MLRCPLACCAVLCAGAALAGEYNEVLDIGDPAPAWKDLPGTDGKKHALDDFQDKELVVVCFTCNSCPTATDYEDRIIAFAKKHADKVGVVAINVNRVAEDKLPKMIARAKKKEFPYPYIYDESQQIARDYGAIFTPEFYVLDRDRKIAYMGGLDDHSDPDLAKEHHLDAAVTALLAGEKPPKTETLAIGCRVRYVRERPKE